jgi:hypothetical protein
MRDVDGTMLDRTALMDHVWRAASLDTKLYDALQAHLGMRLHRMPSVHHAVLQTLYWSRYASWPLALDAPIVRTEQVRVRLRGRNRNAGV